MNNKLQKATKAIVFLLVCAVVQVYVIGNTFAATNAPFGRVEVSQEKFISVNGNTAGSGTTIFSGAQLATPEAVTAAVQLENLGRLEIAPDTNLTVTFDNANVNVAVTKGFALLTTKDGVKGNVTLPESNARTASRGAQTGGEAGLFGLSRAATVVLGAAAFTTIVVTAVVLSNRCRRGRNPSPGVPRGPNDCNNGNGND